jgi:hypothetical protein
MAKTYTLISSNTLSSAAASVTFSSIPSTYTDLVLQCSTRTDRSNQTYDNFRIRFNGDSGTNYSDRVIEGAGGTDIYRSTTSGASQTALGGANLTTNSSTSTANTFGNFELYIPNYNSTSSRPVSEISIFEQVELETHNLHIERLSIELEGIRFATQKKILHYILEHLKTLKKRGGSGLFAISFFRFFFPFIRNIFDG